MVVPSFYLMTYLRGVIIPVLVYLLFPFCCTCFRLGNVPYYVEKGSPASRTAVAGGIRHLLKGDMKNVGTPHYLKAKTTFATLFFTVSTATTNTSTELTRTNMRCTATLNLQVWIVSLVPLTENGRACCV